MLPVGHDRNSNVGRSRGWHHSRGEIQTLRSTGLSVLQGDDIDSSEVTVGAYEDVLVGGITSVYKGDLIQHLVMVIWRYDDGDMDTS